MVSLERSKDNTANIFFNNPPVNSISKQLLIELSNCLEKVSNDKTVRTLIFSSGLEKIKGYHFSAGADLKERALMADSETIDFILKIRSCFDKIENLKISTIAHISGACLGGGLELALCCKKRICIDPKSIFGLPETTIGIIPGAGGTYRLPKIVGVENAKEIILTGKKFGPSKAFQYGLIDNDILKSEDCVVREENSLSLAYDGSEISILAAEKAIDFGLDNSKQESMKFELEQYKRTLTSPKRIEALKKYRK